MDFNGVNQYVDLNTSFGSLTFPMTVSVWYKPSPGQNGAVRFISTHNQSGAYRGFIFQYIGGRLNIQFGAGINRSPAGRWGYNSYQTFVTGRWYHLAAIMHSATNVQLFVNGNAVTTFAGNGSAPHSLSTNNSTGRIGANTAGNVSYLSGQLDELTLWDKALTLTELRDYMCQKLTGSEQGLLAYYRFDDGSGNILSNLKTGGPTGTLKNNPTWVPSSAPIGDRAYYSHDGTEVIGFSQTGDSIVIDPVNGGTNGTHLYVVDTLPSSAAGILVPSGVNYYFGVFNSDYNKNYDLELYTGVVTGLNPPGSLRMAKRLHNAFSPWTLTGATNSPNFILNSQSVISQFIPSEDPCLSFTVNLGADTTLCDYEPLVIGRPKRVGETYQWSIGGGSDSISIQYSGVYWLQVNRPGCVERDTIQVTIYPTNASYLPRDSVSCDSMELVVNGPLNNFTWSNGSATKKSTVYSTSTVWFQATSTLTGCLINDTINARIAHPSNAPRLSLDTILCQAGSFTYDISTPGVSSYLWADGDTHSVRTFSTNDTLWFKRNFAAGCEIFDTLAMSFVPPSNYLPDDTTGCDSIQLQVNAPLINFTWNNGSSANTTVVRSTGQVWFAATDPGSGCTVGDTVNVKVVDRSTTKRLTLDTTLCKPGVNFQYDISSKGAVGYIWEDGDTNSLRNFGSSDTLWFSRVFGANCIVMDTLRLRFAPNTDFLAPDTTACDSVRLQLNGPVSNILWSNGSQLSQTVATSSGRIWFTATDTVYGCSITDTIDVTIIRSSDIPPLSLDTVLCDARSFTYDISTPGVTNYSWNDGSTQLNRTFTTSGTYYFTRTIAGLCDRTDTLTLTFSKLQAALLEKEYFICDNDTVQVQVNPNNYKAIVWSNGDNDFTADYWKAGDYWVKTENVDGCWQVDSFHVNPAPPMNTIKLFHDTSFCAGRGLTLEQPEGYRVTWPNGKGGDYFVGKTGEVRVVISDGCTESVEFFKVSEYSCDCDVKFPNAFTPNDDGLNDLFGPSTLCEFSSFRLEVFSRFGNLIFVSCDARQLFNGKIQGRVLPEGVYTYRFSFSTPHTSGERRGYFSLIR